MRKFFAIGLLCAFAAAGLAASGCAYHFTIEHPPHEPFDAIIIPGCPSEDDGAPSRCQLGQAGNAAVLWRDGWTRNFIVSGGAVHTPYVEAEAIARLMTALGVPAARIVLERDALHSDENVYYSLLLARQLGYDRLAVASFGPIAGWLCSFMDSWGGKCSAIAADNAALTRLLQPRDRELRALRATKVVPWEPLGKREARIARASGHGRPPSYVLYPLYGWLGATHRPIAPEHTTPITYEEVLRGR